MSLNVNTICVGEHTLTLRLTSKALLNFNLKHGQEGTSPVVAVLSAITDLSAKVDLFTAALNHPDNRNDVKNGADLLDLMADSGSWDPNGINDMILQLAKDSGLLSEEDFLALIDPVMESNKKLIFTLSNLLVGKPVGTSQENAEESEENPT